MSTPIGLSVKRREDRRFLTGQGRYVDDLRLADLLHAAIVRSPHAHARVVAIDADRARALPGVLAVLTAADVPGENDTGPARHDEPLFPAEVSFHGQAVAWVVAHKSVDPKRVGVYGGSYGGFMTYMSLFRAPDLFAAGAALRPVSDWTYYNDEYTSNILNRPEDDPEAYTKSSPIEYVAGLQKPLLICDGMLDDNVFFQDNVRLVQRLIELKKENFEMAVYPVEDHGFVQPTSWLDEYRRIFKLFETNLK